MKLMIINIVFNAYHRFRLTQKRENKHWKVVGKLVKMIKLDLLSKGEQLVHCLMAIRKFRHNLFLY